jgi:hypothetical protein
MQLHYLWQQQSGNGVYLWLLGQSWDAVAVEGFIIVLLLLHDVDFGGNRTFARQQSRMMGASGAPRSHSHMSLNWGHIHLGSSSTGRQLDRIYLCSSSMCKATEHDGCIRCTVESRLHHWEAVTGDSLGQ